MYLIVDIKYAFLDFLIDFFGGVDKGFLYIGGSLSRSFHKN